MNETNYGIRTPDIPDEELPGGTLTDRQKVQLDAFLLKILGPETEAVVTIGENGKTDTGLTPKQHIDVTKALDSVRQIPDFGVDTDSDDAPPRTEKMKHRRHPR